jgi:hypothetical protein
VEIGAAITVVVDHTKVVVVVGIKEIGEAITITIRVDMVVQWTATTETMIQAMETTEVVAITVNIIVVNNIKIIEISIKML